MRKVKYFLFLILTLASCDEDFLDKPPLGELTGGNFPATEEDAILAVNAIYSSLRMWQINTGGFPLLDIISDESNKGSNPGDAANLLLYEKFEPDPADNNIRVWWASLYQAIRKANLVVEKVPQIEEMDEVLRQRLLGEARFLRAYFYSNLVRGFGDVVVVLDSQIDFGEKKGRTPKEQVWEKLIFPDLLFAVDALPAKSAYQASDLGRITKGAAHALLARLYLFVGDFQNAEIHAMAVIESGEYALEESFSDAFSVDIVFGSESVFEIGAIEAQGASLGGNQWAQTQGVRGNPSRGWGFNRPSYQTILDFGNDPRLDASVLFLGEEIDGYTIIGDEATPDTTFSESGDIIEIECYNQKVWTPYNTDQNSRGVNRRIIRYADVLLMAAEALNENGKSNQALLYLNEVRQRARGDIPGILPDIETTNKSQLRELIYTERSRELAFEGLRFWDLVRTGRAAQVLGPMGFTEGIHEVFPVPQTEIDISDGKISQNIGYE